MACRMLGAKPLSKPILAYCPSNTYEPILAKFEAKYNIFYSSTKCVWKCRLQNDANFLSASLSYCIFSLSTNRRVWHGQVALQSRHDGRDGVSNYRRLGCILNHLFRRRSQKTRKRRVTGLCTGNSPVIGEFTAQRASDAEAGSIWWRHHYKVASKGWDLNTGHCYFG